MNRLLSTLILGLASTIIPANAATVTLDAPSAAGGFFDVFVQVTGVFDAPHDTDFLLGYGFDVSFDSSILSYLGETPGALFDDLSGNPGIGAQVAGVASAIFLAPGDFVEPLTLAVLHFGVLAAGPAVIGITGDPLNLDQGLIYLTSSEPISASVTLITTPEPNSAWSLLLSVLALGSAIYRRRGYLRSET